LFEALTIKKCEGEENVCTHILCIYFVMTRWVWLCRQRKCTHEQKQDSAKCIVCNAGVACLKHCTWLPSSVLHTQMRVRG